MAEAKLFPLLTWHQLNGNVLNTHRWYSLDELRATGIIFTRCQETNLLGPAEKVTPGLRVIAMRPFAMCRSLLIFMPQM